jgi:multiple sugar transport system permease protein
VRVKPHSSNASAALFALPGIFLLLALMLIPALLVLPIALSNWEFGRPELAFIGLGNFTELAADPRFVKAVRNTIVYAAVVVPLTVLIGLFVALLIQGSGRMMSFYRAAHFLPVVATLSAMAIAWDAVLHPTFGLFNQALSVVGLEPRNWLRDESLVLPTLALIGVWHNLGFAIIMFLAGLKSVPDELLDAAAIDGVVAPIDRLRTVVLPMLAPITLFIGVITAKKALAVFDTVTVMTKGGPDNASEVMLHLLYVESFERLRAGYGAAITVVYLMLLLSVTYAQRTLDRKVHYR